MIAGIFDVLLHIIRSYGNSFHPLGGDKIHKELPKLLPALEWIDGNLNDPEISVSDIAQKIFVSEVYLRKLFHNVTGLSPIAFIQRRRIERACIELKGTAKGIKEISGTYGFLEIPFFYRIFKQWTGKTPAQYRQGREP